MARVHSYYVSNNLNSEITYNISEQKLQDIITQTTLPFDIDNNENEEFDDNDEYEENEWVEDGEEKDAPFVWDKLPALGESEPSLD